MFGGPFALPAPSSPPVQQALLYTGRRARLPGAPPDRGSDRRRCRARVDDHVRGWRGDAWTGGVGGVNGAEVGVRGNGGNAGAVTGGTGATGGASGTRGADGLVAGKGGNGGAGISVGGTNNSSGAGGRGGTGVSGPAGTAGTTDCCPLRMTPSPFTSAAMAVPVETASQAWVETMERVVGPSASADRVPTTRATAVREGTARRAWAATAPTASVSRLRSRVR